MICCVFFGFERRFLFRSVLLVQGRKVLDIDHPDGPFGTKVSFSFFTNFISFFSCVMPLIPFG